MQVWIITGTWTWQVGSEVMATRKHWMCSMQSLVE